MFWLLVLVVHLWRCPIISYQQGWWDQTQTGFIVRAVVFVFSIRIHWYLNTNFSVFASIQYSSLFFNTVFVSYSYSLKKINVFMNTFWIHFEYFCIILFKYSLNNLIKIPTISFLFHLINLNKNTMISYKSSYTVWNFCTVYIQRSAVY